MGLVRTPEEIAEIQATLRRPRFAWPALDTNLQALAMAAS
jgi:hypothetical protein